MTWIKDYIIPSAIVLMVSLLVCLGLWGVFITSAENTTLDDTETSSVIVENTEEELPDIGILTPILLFIANGLKVGIFMGVPALITLSVLKRLDTNKAPEKIVTS